MKKCSFCAEDIQDAAIVCKHCGRDLAPKVAAKKKSGGCATLFGIGILGIVALAFLGILANVFGPSAERDGVCSLHAIAGVITQDTPLARVTHWETDVLAIRSRDAADWNDVEVTIYGFETIGKSKQQTGAYRLKKDYLAAGALGAFNLNDFENDTGHHWASLTMSVDVVDVKATMHGQSCSAEITPSTTGM